MPSIKIEIIERGQHSRSVIPDCFFPKHSLINTRLSGKNLQGPDDIVSCFGAFVRGQCVGVIFFAENRQEILWLYVEENFRQQGIANALIDEVLSLLDLDSAKNFGPVRIPFDFEDRKEAFEFCQRIGMPAVQPKRDPRLGEQRRSQGFTYYAKPIDRMNSMAA